MMIRRSPRQAGSQAGPRTRLEPCHEMLIKKWSNQLINDASKEDHSRGDDPGPHDAIGDPSAPVDDNLLGLVGDGHLLDVDDSSHQGVEDAAQEEESRLEAEVDRALDDGRNKSDQEAKAEAHPQGDAECEAAKLEVCVEEGVGRGKTGQVDEVGRFLRLAGALSHGVVVWEAGGGVERTDFYKSVFLQ